MLSAFAFAVRRPPSRERTDRSRVVTFVLGVVAFWLAADWPIGPLGAGYLVSVHTAQFLVFTMVVPPLLLHGLPPWLLRRLLHPPAIQRSALFFTRPLIAFVIFNVVMVATHFPAVVDTLRPTQVGSFGVDMAWLFAGILFWWVVLGPLDEFRPLSYPGRIVFLLLNVFIPTVPASFLTFADYPVYALYELAPRVGSISATQDQQLAGLTMKILGGFIIFGTASVLFFRWYGAERALDSDVT
jgi:putative membrane protein